MYSVGQPPPLSPPPPPLHRPFVEHVGGAGGGAGETTPECSLLLVGEMWTTCGLLWCFLGLDAGLFGSSFIFHHRSPNGRRGMKLTS